MTSGKPTGWEAVAEYDGEYTVLLHTCRALAALLEAWDEPDQDIDMDYGCANVLAAVQQTEYLLRGKDCCMAAERRMALRRMQPACCRAIYIITRSLDKPLPQDRELILYSLSDVVACIREYESLREENAQGIRRKKRRLLEQEQRRIARESST